jgi:hypothetical protein
MMGKGKSSSIFRNTFRNITPSTFLLILLDFLSYAALFILISSFLSVVFQYADATPLPEGDISTIDMRVLGSYLPALKSLYGFLLTLSAISILSVILLWSLSRAIIWKLSIKEKLSMKYCLKSLPLGLLWFTIGLIPLLAIIYTLKQSIIVSPIYIFILIYLSTILFLNYAKKERFLIFRETFKNALSWRFFLAFLILSIIFIILTTAGIFVLLRQPLNMAIFYIIGLAVILLFYLALARFCLIEVQKEADVKSRKRR